MNRNRFQKERTLNKWLLVFLCLSYLLPGIACNKNAYAKAKIKGKKYSCGKVKKIIQ